MLLLNDSLTTPKCIIYDFDGTLFGETLFVTGEKILKAAYQAGIKQSLATFNSHGDFYCRRYGISQYFDVIKSKRMTDCKLSFIKQIITWYNQNGSPLEEKDCIFLEDNEDNIRCITKETNVRCIKVDPKVGVQWEHLPFLKKIP